MGQGPSSSSSSKREDSIARYAGDATRAGGAPWDNTVSSEHRLAEQDPDDPLVCSPHRLALHQFRQQSLQAVRPSTPNYRSNSNEEISGSVQGAISEFPNVSSLQHSSFPNLQPPINKPDALVPGWSRTLSSQLLQIECQQILNPRSVLRMPPRQNVAVLDMEVMKFVAYCGGLSVKFRIDCAQQHAGNTVSWGLVSTRACTALLHAPTQLQVNKPVGCGAPRSGGSTSEAKFKQVPSEGSSAQSSPSAACINPLESLPPANSVAPVSVENVARKPLYIIASAGSSSVALEENDVLSIDLAPREDKFPVIAISLRLNGRLMDQQALPCCSITSLQMYPFLTVNPGMSCSLHEAYTPSPLFTWFHPSNTLPAGMQLSELDTSVKMHAQGSIAPSSPSCSIDIFGSTAFVTGRHRWTVQLDNLNAASTAILVGVMTTPSKARTMSCSHSLAYSQGPLHSGMAEQSGESLNGEFLSQDTSLGPASPTATPPRSGDAGVPFSPDVASGSGINANVNKWGAWVQMPGVGSSGANLPAPQPTSSEGLSHVTNASTNHCFITIDLDLTNGYVRFFRNGHIIGSAFFGLKGPVSPCITMLSSSHVHCQASLVNITKLRQLDLGWNPEHCSADLRLIGPSVSKASEMYGDYSTVLATEGFISGIHLWLIRVDNLSEPDSIFIGVCRGCMPLDQDPQDLRDRTYYLSNGVIRVGGRRVVTNAANFSKGDVVGVILDADQGEIVFFRNGQEQGRARGIRGRLYPFISCDSEADQITLLGSYSLLMDRTVYQLADMEWDTLHHAQDIELSSNCLTCVKTSSTSPSTLRGTMIYTGLGYHEYHVILDSLGPDGVWVGVAPPEVTSDAIVGDAGCGWALHSDGDKRMNGKEEEFTQPFQSGDVLSVCLNLGKGTLGFRRNGLSLGEAFVGLSGPLIAAATLSSEESKITIQNRPTVLNTGEYTGGLRWDDTRAGRDLHVIDGLTVTKMANEGGDYATALGSLCLASGQHAWNIYVNHVEDSNLFIGASVGGHDLNADPQEMKSRTYYLSNGTIRVAGKLVTRCAEPYAEGDLVSVQLDMDRKEVKFLKNGVLQGEGDGLPEEVWPYVSLDNVMDSITLHSSSMFMDLLRSFRWDPETSAQHMVITDDGTQAKLQATDSEENIGHGTVLGMCEFAAADVHSWTVSFEQGPVCNPSNFLLGVAPASMDPSRSLGEDGCGIGLDYYGYIYVNGRYFHLSNLHNWTALAKPVRGSTAKHKGKAQPALNFHGGMCEVMVTLDLKEQTLKFSHGGQALGTITGVQGPLYAAATLTSCKQKVALAPGPINRPEHTNGELLKILHGKGCQISPRMETAFMLIPRDLFVPRDRHREAFRDQKLTVRLADGSSLTLPPPSSVLSALEKIGVGSGCSSFLDIGCGTGYVTALAACLMGEEPHATIHAIESTASRLETARANLRALKDQLSGPSASDVKTNDDPVKMLDHVQLFLANVLIPECTNGTVYDAVYCDASVKEEDLPTLLSLLKPNGRMMVIIQEEALLITRSSLDPHDFSREVVSHLNGDFEELEEATPWELQDAIQRIKQRERKAGQNQAKQDMATLRSFESAEVQQRLQAAVQRISELEAMVQRSDLATSLRSPKRSCPVSPFSPQDRGLRSPARSGGLDDVSTLVKDKSRRNIGSSTKTTPRPNSTRMSPLPQLNVPDSCDWKAMYTIESKLPSPSPSRARARAKTLFVDPPDQSGSDALTPTLSFDKDGMKDYYSIPGTPCLKTPGSMTAMVASQIQMSQQAFDDIMDSMSIHMFSPDQIATMIFGCEPTKVERRDVFHGSYKGMRVRVWRMNTVHGLAYVDLKRLHSKFCVAHPNISAVLGLCIQPCFGTAAAPSAAPENAEHIHDGNLQSPSVSRMAAAPNSRLARMSSLALRDEREVGASTPGNSFPATPPTAGTPTQQASSEAQHTLWVVEESFGDRSLYTQLERGLLSWQQVCRIATDLCKALTFLQDPKRLNGCATIEASNVSESGWSASNQADEEEERDDGVEGTYNRQSGSQPVVLSAYALRALVNPCAVHLDAQNTKVSVLPALLHHLETACGQAMPSTATPMHSDMAYVDPNSYFSLSEGGASSLYAFGVVLLQLLTEQSPLGLVSAVKGALERGTLLNLVPRIPASAEMSAWASSFAQLALRCMQPGAVSLLETDLLPELEALGSKLAKLGSMSWEQVEELLMLPLQPYGSSGGSNRRWVRHDFRMRRKLFLEEVSKLAVEWPVNKIEVRRARCFKDSVVLFSGKGHSVWRQPLKVTFIGEQGMDSGGVTREWFSTLSSAISRGSPELFSQAGAQQNQLYINPLSSSTSHLKKFHFVGLFMAKAILETAARGAELGSVTLNLPFAEPFWKLLLGQSLHLVDLQLLDPTEFRSLVSLLDLDINGLIFETFAWSFHHSTAGAGAQCKISTPATPGFMSLSPARNPSAEAGLPPSAADLEVATPSGPSGSAAIAAAASPFSAVENGENMVTSIPLKPGGTHLKVTNNNKREYVLLKAHKMLVGAIEAQMTSIMDAFHSIIPRELLEKYSFTSMELQLVICGEQHVDIQDLHRHCKYEDGYKGTEEVITWFWEVVISFDDAQRRMLLQFWSGSDGMPAEGFGSLDPAFHIVAVDRLYDLRDTTARLPAAHTCFRQLDLPRYRSVEELREKLVTAITIGQGYMALS